jgi:hypothetical protein
MFAESVSAARLSGLGIHRNLRVDPRLKPWATDLIIGASPELRSVAAIAFR